MGLKMKSKGNKFSVVGKYTPLESKIVFNYKGLPNNTRAGQRNFDLQPLGWDSSVINGSESMWPDILLGHYLFLNII